MKNSQTTKNSLISTALAIALAFGISPVPLCLSIAADAIPTNGGEKVPSKNSYVNTNLSSIFKNWLRIPALKHSTPGLELMDVKSRKVLYSYNGSRRFTPASTVKAITCACAFETFKGSYQYNTSILAEGTMDGNTLNGNIVLVPSQDPTLMRQDIINLVNKAFNHPINDSTIKNITGRVLIKLPNIKSSGFHPSWLVEDWGRHWMPVSSSLVMDRNITHTAGLIPGYKKLKANSMHGKLFDVLLSSKGGPGWVYLDPTRKIQFIYQSNHRETPDSVTLAISNPDQFNRAILQDLIERKGIKVGNKNIAVGTNSSVYQLASHSSSPLSAIIKRTLYKSDNLYAQQLLRSLGLNYLQSRSSPPSDSATLEDYGIVAIHNWLKTVGVPGQEIILYDGCGLCRKNGVSPHSLNLILTHMANDPELAPYIDLLKCHDETNSNKGTYKFKTGTMDSIRAISGILTTSGKQTFALTIMVNGHTPSIRDLRIAMSGLINQLRVIKQMGKEIPVTPTASPEDSGLTTNLEQQVIVDTKALQAGTSKRSRSKSRTSSKKRSSKRSKHK